MPGMWRDISIFRFQKADTHHGPLRVDQRHSSVVASNSEGNRSSRPQRDAAYT